MRTALEHTLLDELLDLKDRGSAFLDESVQRNSAAHYTCAARFAQERAFIHNCLPTAAAHGSELAAPGSFVRRQVGGKPVLITRDTSGKARAFINACRHRGTRLVDAEEGCQKRFTCPYHAWTYGSDGALVAAPQFSQGFPESDKKDLGLTPLACEERFGFIWVAAQAPGSIDMDQYLGPLGDDLGALNMSGLTLAQQDTQHRQANWKIIVEGGIEAYHFKVAHRATIGPYFEDNLSTYRVFGPHLRSILARASLSSLRDQSRDVWRLRDHAQILYTLMPGTIFLVQQDHVVWVSLTALSVNRSQIRLVTLAPADALDDRDHWAKSHAITRNTLNEDFDIAESIQQSLDAGAVDDLLFGRFEGALAVFNKTVDSMLPAHQSS